MKRVLLLALCVSALLVGCGTTHVVSLPTASSATGGVQPPDATVTVGSQRITMQMNGYQWSQGNHVSIGDAASDPATNLQKHIAKAGALVKLSSFERPPTSVQLTMWSNGLQVSQSTLSDASFTLPRTSGDYIYEVTARWNRDYVNYEFEVQVQ